MVARRALTWILPGATTVGWLGYVTLADQWDRVATQWRAALTMVVGSFVAGSTPQGGGAVAFPVFTKVLEVPADVARTFSLSIQATGMVMASAIILLAGRAVERRTLRLGVMGGAVGLLFGLFVLNDPSDPRWGSRIPAPYVKVSFTIAVAMVAYIVLICVRERDKGTTRIEGWTTQARVALLGATFVGGAFSSLTGSGVDVFLFLFAVVIAGLHPRVGIPTSVIAMAVVSTLGFVILGLIDGQLDVTLVGDQVVAVGGTPVTPGPASRFDTFGLWLAAIPIVVWGAPLGSLVAAVLRDNRLVVFVGTLALAEVATTVIFLDQLRSDIVLATYFALGLIAALGAIRWLATHGNRIMAPAVSSPSETTPSRG